MKDHLKITGDIISPVLDEKGQDPADRFQAATAIVYDFTLVTADSRIISAKDVPVLAAV